jgi:6-phosphogluconolactonase
VSERPGRVVVQPAEALARSCGEWLADRMNCAIAERGHCTIALAGGSSPRPVYAALCAPPLWAAIPWHHVHVYFGDERAVPSDDPESNYRMACDTLLCRVPVPHTQVHRMEAERADLDAAADDYARILPAQLDVLLLGMGPDGHAASLFPGSPALVERARRVVPVTGPTPPRRRLTITPPVIEAARNIVLIATGAEKAAAAAAALEGPPSLLERLVNAGELTREEAADGARRDLILQALGPQAGVDVPARLARRGTWFLDPAAAAQLEGS